MASDKSVPNQIASLRVIIVQDPPPAPAPALVPERGAAAPHDGIEADRVYPAYKVRVFGTGIPTGSGSGMGVATMIGPHTSRMNVLSAGVYEISLLHNNELDENPDLLINFVKVG